MLDNANEICFKKNSLLKVKDIKKDPGNFIKSQLVVPDSLNGISRYVDIEYLIKEDLIYLKTIKPLFKKEFELLFGFESGQFKIGKIISINLDSVIIN